MPELPSDVFRKIQAGASTVRSAGDQLNSCISLYEQWLNRLSGRVHACCTVWTDPNSGAEEMLSLDRDGKQWSLFVYETDPRDDEGVHNHVLLRDASLERKLSAIRAFPRLLEAIANQQKDFAAQATAAAAEFDTFAAAIGLKKEGA